MPITAAAYLLLVIFWSPSTSSGVITVFLRNSSSVVTGIPMSDELQPCCTFMSNRRGLLGATGAEAFWCCRRRRRRSRLLASQPQVARWLIRRAANRLCAAPRITHSPVPPPLLDPVKDKNQPLNHPPSALKAHRLSQKLFNPNPVALKRPVVRGSQSADTPELAWPGFTPAQ